MTQVELIAELRSALSWTLANQASNPAFQALLEFQRDKEPKTHINPLGARQTEYWHLFDDTLLDVGESAK